jgi:dipeptidase
MCDTFVHVDDDGVLFAKSSDRDANEAQLLDWQPRLDHAASDRVRCTWIDVPEVPRTWAVLLSRPFWMWGAEMGVNEHGLAVGNEAVFTRTRAARIGLTGMDLVRLALERARSAYEGVQVITALIEEHGQGGGCGFEHASFRYNNSFLLADPHEAWVLETAGRAWAAERVSRGTRSISNVLTIRGFAEEHSDPLRARVSQGQTRAALTRAIVDADPQPSLSTMMRALRHHGHGDPERPATGGHRYRFLTGTLDAPCMHGGGWLASAVTTSSWTSQLRHGETQHWVTATSSPCLSLFKPVWVDQPLPAPETPAGRDDARSLWWAHERLHRLVLRSPARLRRLFAAERDVVEARWLAAPPDTLSAFAEHRRRLNAWTSRVRAALTHGPVADERPAFARRWWRKRDRRAQLLSDRALTDRGALAPVAGLPSRSLP